MANLKVVAAKSIPAHIVKTVNVVKSGLGFKVHNQVSDGSHSQVYVSSPVYDKSLKTLCIPNYVAP